MARLEQRVIKVVATVRRAGTNATNLRTGLATLQPSLTSNILTRLGVDVTGVVVEFKFKAFALGSNRYQLYPKFHISGDHSLDRATLGLRLNAVRDGIVDALTTHVSSINATLLEMYTKDYGGG